jgi:hypothetical protein
MKNCIWNVNFRGENPGLSVYNLEPPAGASSLAREHAKHPVSAHGHLCGLYGRRRAAPRAKRRRRNNGAFGSDGAVGSPADADDAAKSVEQPARKYPFRAGGAEAERCHRDLSGYAITVEGHAAVRRKMNPRGDAKSLKLAEKWHRAGHILRSPVLGGLHHQYVRI